MQVVIYQHHVFSVLLHLCELINIGLDCGDDRVAIAAVKTQDTDLILLSAIKIQPASGIWNLALNITDLKFMLHWVQLDLPPGNSIIRKPFRLEGFTHSYFILILLFQFK